MAALRSRVVVADGGAVGSVPGRIGGGTGVEHLPRGDVDEEQHVAAAGEPSSDGAEQSPIIVVYFGSIDLSVKG